jgi:ankyrin repeat protein
LLKLNEKKLINLSVDGLTCLHLSCQKGLYDFSKILIDNGADINILSEYGSNSPLHIALKFNNDLNSEYHKIIKYLIEKNIEINSYDENEVTPLFIAAAKNDLEIFNLLLDKGANINTKTTSHKNILHYMISSPEYFRISKNDDKILKLIIDKGIKVDDLDINNRNSLHSACNYLSLEYVDWIINISNKLNINLSNEKDINGLTPLDLVKISKIDNYQLNNYILNLNTLIKINFANLDYTDNKKNAELKILNYFLKNQEKIINIFND